VAPFRTLAPVVAVAALAAAALTGCSNASSSGATSTSTSASAPSSSATETAVPSVTITGTPSLPSVDASRLTAIGTCLKNAGLPTPTSTGAVAAAAELVRLLQDPATVAALRDCGISFPSAPTTSTT